MAPRAIDPPALAAPGAALEAAGASIAGLVQVRVNVTDIAHWPVFDAIYAEWAGTHKPARAVVPVPQLHFGSLIEIEAIAALPSA